MSNRSIGSLIGAAVIATGLMAIAGSAQAVIITSGDIKLGVDTYGQLNVSPGPGETGTVNVGGGVTGIAYNFSGGYRDATSPGCLCEGFGLSASGVSGWADNAIGISGLTAPTTSNVTATTVTVDTGLSALPGLTITQAYAPSVHAPGALFENKVMITNNTGAAATDVRYVRAMDWDVPLTEFNEFVTIAGTATTGALELSHDNGFSTPDPLAATSASLGGTTNVDFTDSGPADHGAYFKFNFGDLADGESKEFSIYYGAAGTEAAMLAALGAESIELYSLGQSNTTVDSPTLGTPATYAFGFKGVGGEVILPNPLPEPGTIAVFGIGLAGIGIARRRRRG